jgi:hypothetical protein
MEVEMERILVEEMLRVLTHEHRMKMMRNIQNKMKGTHVDKDNIYLNAITVIMTVDDDEEEEKSN